MQPVANTKTDASGQFTFDNPNIGAQPMLIRAVYKGVNFHQPLPPGKDSISVDVFEPTGDAKNDFGPFARGDFSAERCDLDCRRRIRREERLQAAAGFFRADGNFEAALAGQAQN